MNSYDYDRRKSARLSPLQLYSLVETLAKDARTYTRGGYTRRGQRINPLDRSATPNDLLEARFAARDQMERAQKVLAELPTDEAKRQFTLAIDALKSVVSESEPLLRELPADGAKMGESFSRAQINFRIALMEVEGALKSR